MYVELKSGCSDRGPAWIGIATFSKSGRTVYFNGQAFQSRKGAGIGANFYDIETGDEYWISGVKKNEQNRHWAGTGPIHIDRAVVSDYLKEIGKDELDSSMYILSDFAGADVRARINQQQNKSGEGTA